MAQESTVNGKIIWLTRPAGQGAGLLAALQDKGARVVHLPLLAIEALSPSQADRQKLIDLDHYHLVFFVSTNAALLGLDAIAQWWPQYPVGIRNFAVGPGTAAVIEARGLEASYPRERMSSEALLALPELQDVAGKRALIIRGAGGREIIADGLRQRGATVDYAELYARKLPSYEPRELQALLRATPPDALVISSADALENLKTLFTPVNPRWEEMPLVLSSQRLADLGSALGFKRCSVIAGATDAAIIQQLPTLFDGESRP